MRSQLKGSSVVQIGDLIRDKCESSSVGLIVDFRPNSWVATYKVRFLDCTYGEWLAARDVEENCELISRGNNAPR